MLRYRASRGKEIRGRLPERRGINSKVRAEGHLIWLHAASVGEALSVLPVISALVCRAPTLSILLTTGTVTSAALLDQRLRKMGLDGRVIHQFAPLDVPAWAARFLDHWRPGAVGFVESELWPNILTACQQRAIPAILINARMSLGSFASWSRAPKTARDVMGLFTEIFARSGEDARRLESLGATYVQSLGDLKMAALPLPADPALLAEMAARLAGHPVFLAASTHPGEENILKEVHDQLAVRHPGLITIIVPRHPERGVQLAVSLGAPRRQSGPPAAGGVWIADSLGELGVWYRLSDVVLIGRSLIPPGGGQNPLEPARLGRAIATGPYVGNFSEHVRRLREAGALTVIGDTPALVHFVDTMLADPKARVEMGERAKAMADLAGALPGQIADGLLEIIAREGARSPPGPENASGPLHSPVST